MTNNLYKDLIKNTEQGKQGDQTEESKLERIDDNFVIDSANMTDSDRDAY